MNSAGITISGRQRNLLYKAILDYLSVANDIYHAARHGLYEEAQRLALQTNEELIFVVSDLGWRGREADEVIPVRTPPSIVQRVVERILDEARREVFEGTQAEIRELEGEVRELWSACEEVLAVLPAEGAPMRKSSQDLARVADPESSRKSTGRLSGLFRRRRLLG